MNEIMKTFIICLIVTFLGVCSFSKGFSQSTFTAKDTNNQIKTLSITSSYKAQVFIFLSPECPLCQNYTLVLNNLFTKYNKFGIAFTGIVSSNSFKIMEAKTFATRYQILFPIYLNNNSIAKYFKASITPEVVVTDSLGKKIYQGRIDNWAYDIGKKRKQATIFDLDETLNSIINNEKRSFLQTKAIGCFLE